MSIANRTLDLAANMVRNDCKMAWGGEAAQAAAEEFHTRAAQQSSG